MDKRLDKIEDKVDTIKDSIHSIDKTLQRNTNSLEYHIKRTDILDDKTNRIETFQNKLIGGFKLFGIITAVVGATLLVIKLFNI